MVLDIAKYKPNRIVFHDFDVCVVFFFIILLSIWLFLGEIWRKQKPFLFKNYYVCACQSFFCFVLDREISNEGESFTYLRPSNSP